jgi:hypothetical protein
MGVVTISNCIRAPRYYWTAWSSLSSNAAAPQSISEPTKRVPPRYASIHHLCDVREPERLHRELVSSQQGSTSSLKYRFNHRIHVPPGRYASVIHCRVKVVTVRFKKPENAYTLTIYVPTLHWPSANMGTCSPRSTVNKGGSGVACYSRVSAAKALRRCYFLDRGRNPSSPAVALAWPTWEAQLQSSASS